jgi:hypothetical protein
MPENQDEIPPDPQEFTEFSPNPEGDVDLSVLCDALQEAGVSCVVARYEGSGDSGAVAEVEYAPEGCSVPAWVQDKLLVVAEGYCPDGYENNEGGYGSLTVFPFAGLAQLEHYDRQEDTEPMDAGPARLPAPLRRRLSALGVTAVTAHFDGYGDSGAIDGFSVEPGTAVLGADLEGALEDFLLGRLPGGWQDNEGCYGEFAIDVQGSTVEAEAWWRVEKDADVRLTRWSWRQ